MTFYWIPLVTTSLGHQIHNERRLGVECSVWQASLSTRGLSTLQMKTNCYDYRVEHKRLLCSLAVRLSPVRLTHDLVSHVHNAGAFVRLFGFCACKMMRAAAYLNRGTVRTYTAVWAHQLVMWHVIRYESITASPSVILNNNSFVRRSTRQHEMIRNFIRTTMRYDRTIRTNAAKCSWISECEWK